jgi:hypothetical protein
MYRRNLACLTKKPRCQAKVIEQLEGVTLSKYTTDLSNGFFKFQIKRQLNQWYKTGRNFAYQDAIKWLNKNG